MKKRIFISALLLISTSLSVSAALDIENLTPELKEEENQIHVNYRFFPGTKRKVPQSFVIPMVERHTQLGSISNLKPDSDRYRNINGTNGYDDISINSNNIFELKF